jgi:hypothetical protein
MSPQSGCELRTTVLSREKSYNLGGMVHENLEQLHRQANSAPNSYLGVGGKIGLTPVLPIKRRHRFVPN